MARHVGAGFAVVVALAIGLVPVAMAKSKSALSETDTYALEIAESACSNGEFASLMQAMAISDAVRLRYSAPTINMVVDGNATSVPSDSYDDFPIGMLDYYWVTRASMRGWDSGAAREDITVEFNQSQANQWTIDWQQVRYGPNTSGEEDLGEITERIGEPGVLSFEPFDGCWRLIEDSRGQY